jgi:hypothetical protein
MSKEKECSQCKKTPYNQKQWVVVLIGSYLLFASVYGTIEVVKNLIQLFK